MVTIPMLKLWTADRGKVAFVFTRSSVVKDAAQVRLARDLLSMTLRDRIVFRHV